MLYIRISSFLRLKHCLLIAVAVVGLAVVAWAVAGIVALAVVLAEIVALAVAAVAGIAVWAVAGIAVWAEIAEKHLSRLARHQWLHVFQR